MLELCNLSKTFFDSSVNRQAVRSVNLKIKKGEFFSLLGPSGCGKTTLLRLIAGFEKPSDGEILLHDKKINRVTAQRRPFNIVFQKYALFPHLTVFDNVAFGLRMKKTGRMEIKKRVQHVLDLVNMNDFGSRYPATLSGGQAQRIAIARAVVNEPQVLLLDEPLSALDQRLREHMQYELKELQRKLGMTFVYVTHDQEEALLLSDRIGVMHEGVLKQVSTPQDLYHKPKTMFTAKFIGSLTQIEEGFVRPEKIKIVSQPIIGEKFYSGKVQAIVFRGIYNEIIVELINQQKIKVFTQQSDLSLGKEIQLSVAPSDFIFHGEMT